MACPRRCPAVPVLLLAVVLPVTGAAGTAEDAPSAARPASGDAAPDYSKMSLEELLQVKISVATREDRPEENLRNSPAIVSLLTSDEIRKSGARELKDLLQLVPGFYFGTNDTGVIGLGTRGQWSHEGKALLLLDGLELMDLHSGSLQFGNHYPVDQIDRIEIIRGPGSAVYGGSAELAVINVVTRSGEQLGGAEAAVSYGRMGDGLARSDLTLAAGDRASDRLSWSASSLLGHGQRSDRSYTDILGNSYSLDGNSDLDPMFVEAGLSYAGLTARFLLDRYHTTSADSRLGGVRNLEHAEQLDLDTAMGRVGYRAALGAKLSLEPYLAYKWNEPWKTVGSGVPGLDYFFTYRKATEGAIATYRATDGASLQLGTEFSQLEGVQHTGTWATTGSDTKRLDSGAVYVQALVNTHVANLSLGARYEDSSGSPAAVVPRLGATRILGRWHFKLLYGEGFKTPSLTQIDFSATPGSIDPEKTRVAELEAGWQVAKQVWAAVNLYNTTLADPIVYDPVAGFQNFGDVVTRGLEAELRVRDHWGDSTLGYSYYRAADNGVAAYAVPGHDTMLLGFPAHTITSRSSIGLGLGGLRLSPTLVWYGPRYGYQYDPRTTPAPGLARFAPAFLASVYVSYANALVDGLSFGVGVFNIFDTPELYPQPYDGGHGPLPDTSRELLLRVGYRLPF